MIDRDRTLSELAPIDRVLSQLDPVRQVRPLQWEARCPAHKDRNPSLSIATGDDGIVLLHCHGGCQPLRVLAAIGLSFADLYPDDKRSKAPLRSHVYQDAGGQPVRRVSKLRGGKYRTEHFADGAWRSGAGSLTPVLYRWPRLIESHSEVVHITEGEKDADAIAGLGLVATTVASGGWTGVDTGVLAGREVDVIIDNDAAGWKKGCRSRDAAAASGASSVRVLRPPDQYNDVTELLDDGGHMADLVEVDIEREAPPTPATLPGRLQPAFLPNGRSRYRLVPTGVFLSLIQQGLVLPADVAVWVLMEERAGQTSTARLTGREIGVLLRLGEKSVRASLLRLTAVGLVNQQRRGHWTCHNPCETGRRGDIAPDLFFWDQWYENTPFLSPRSPHMTPVSRSDGPVRAAELTSSSEYEPVVSAGSSWRCSDPQCDWDTIAVGQECRCLHCKLSAE